MRICLFLNKTKDKPNLLKSDASPSSRVLQQFLIPS